MRRLSFWGREIKRVLWFPDSSFSFTLKDKDTLFRQNDFILYFIVLTIFYLACQQQISLNLFNDNLDQASTF